MEIKTLCLGLIFFSVALYCQGIMIRGMRRISVGEAIKGYGPQGHVKKRGTPGMGGIVAFALIPFMAASMYFCGLAGRTELVKIWSFPMMTGLVGLADDLLKYFHRSSEGLRSLQKLFFQIAVGVPWAYFASRGGVYVTPDLILPFYFGMPLLSFFAVGIQNAVNVTDGLDGLAAGASVISLLSFFVWAGGESVLISSALGVSVLLAFLWHNANPAELFMGDVGSHLWAGLLISLCVAARSLVFVIPISFIFGVELLTSAIQIVSIRGFGKKVFRMSPLHHHYELLGLSESAIVVRFWLAHAVGLVAGIIILLTLMNGGISSVWQ
jgi:phospho-N-acetylmuramoyl-pentapeptide-transferase